jgi:hypothetical protein
MGQGGGSRCTYQVRKPVSKCLQAPHHGTRARSQRSGNAISGSALRYLDVAAGYNTLNLKANLEARFFSYLYSSLKQT